MLLKRFVIELKQPCVCVFPLKKQHPHQNGMEVQHTYRQHNTVSKAETVDVELGKVANLSRISIWELRNNRRA